MADHQNTETEIPEVTGYLDIKRDIYQMILVWYVGKKRERKSKSTKLPVKGNKSKALKMLKNYVSEKQDELNQMYGEEQEEFAGDSKPESNKKEDVLLADYFEKLLKFQKLSLENTTYGNKGSCVENIIGPYFREKGLTVQKATAQDILDYYEQRLLTVKATSVHKEHTILNQTFNLAIEDGLIQESPMKKVKRPKAARFNPKFLIESEAIELMDRIKDNKKLGLVVFMTTFYGLRRGEVAGLSWPLINFEAKTFKIGPTIVEAKVNGKKKFIFKESGKTDDSERVYPLTPLFEQLLLKLKQEQEENKRLYGSSYNKKYAQYVFVDEMGNIVKPNYYTREFPKWCEENGFQKFRFHDLRHSCASLMLATGGVTLKHIQEWLGHRNFKITAELYSHLEYKSKITAANSMSWVSETAFSDNNAPTDMKMNVKENFVDEQAQFLDTINQSIINGIPIEIVQKALKEIDTTCSIKTFQEQFHKSVGFEMDRVLSK